MSERIASAFLRNSLAMIGLIGSRGICTDDPGVVPSIQSLLNEVQIFLIAADSAFPGVATLATARTKSSSKSDTLMLLGFCLVVSVSLAD